MKNKLNYLTLLRAALGLALLSVPAHAATIYNWTGGAGSGSNWYDTGNWDGGVAPGASGDRMQVTDAGDLAVFDSETAVGGYITPFAFNMLRSTSSGPYPPSISILNGTLNWGFSANQAIGSTFTVGDGDLGTMATLNLDNTIYLNHGTSSSKSYVVNADGTLALGADVLNWSSGGGLTTVARLVGGTMNISGAVNGNLTNVAGNYVNFEAPGSTFTASYGGQFADLTAVSGQIGDSFKDTTGFGLAAIDNGGTTFTVSVVPEPSAALLGALGLLALLRRRR